MRNLIGTVLALAMLAAQVFVWSELAREEPPSFTERVSSAPSSIWSFIAPGGGSEEELAPALKAYFWKGVSAFQESTRTAWRFWGVVSLTLSIIAFLVVCIRKSVRWGLDIGDAVDAGGVSFATFGSLLILKGCWFLIASGYRLFLS